MCDIKYEMQRVNDNYAIKQVINIGKFIDLTGQKFGRLTVIERADKTKCGSVKWLCKCDCGNEVVVNGTALRNGGTKSCGCLHIETARNQGSSRLIDLTGQRFGRLTVLRRAEDHVQPNGQRKTQWLCKCDCGNEAIVQYQVLTRGEAESCGCLNKELTIKRNRENRKLNYYDLTGEYGIGFTSKGEEFYFDLEDYDKIKDYTWSIDNRGYVYSSFTENNKTIRISMHRVIMNIQDKFWKNAIADHIHGENTLNDNRKSNLRIVTPSQNSMNTKLRKDNTSGFTGVNWDKDINRWISRITVNKKKIKLGTFENFEDAVKSRKEAEEKYFGEYSYDNSQKEVI